MIKTNWSLLLILLPFMFSTSLAATTTASVLQYLQQIEVALDDGKVYTAFSLLEQAEQYVSSPDEQNLLTLAKIDALLDKGQLETAETELEALKQHIDSSRQARFYSAVLQRQGHLAIAQGKHSSAQSWYQQALVLAQATHDVTQIVTLLINLNQVSQRPGLLTQAYAQIRQIDDHTLGQRLRLNLAYQASQQGQVKLAYQALQAVLKNPSNSRVHSQALGNLAMLYSQQLRTDEALRLTEQALLTDASPDLQLTWHWQRARLLARIGKRFESLTAYRNAIEQLQILRIDIPITYQNGQSSFNQTYVPLYSQFITTLLQQAKQSPAEEQALLAEIINTWEQLKAFELEDYFRDSCTVKQQKTAIIEADTAMLYPILLDNQLALVIRFADKFQVYTVPQTAAQVKSRVYRMAETLNQYMAGPDDQEIAILDRKLQQDSRTLYQWLIAPVRGELNRRQIKTLVYLPDGVLRKIPFALLHDGQHYLTEDYALVTVPGLSMLATPSRQISRNDILLAGMEKPGPVIHELINSHLNIIDIPTEDQCDLLSPAQKRVLKQKLDTKQLRLADAELRAYCMQELYALPGVTKELKTLSTISLVKVMENDDFILSRFKTQVHQGHSIVHIASHGFFSGNPEQSFIMTYDHLLNMQQLSTLFQSEAYLDNPIELVSLSACETAEGDDRSPLGLTGVVVQAGVKSAIGTLWPVVDEAAKQFFSDFYLNYQTPGMSKSRAMQLAQNKLLKNPEMNHPIFWAPFILVGEWH